MEPEPWYNALEDDAISFNHVHAKCSRSISHKTGFKLISEQEDS